MILHLPAVLLSSHLVLAAEQIPHFDLEPACRAAADTAVAPNRTPDSCKHDENDARAKIEKEWSQFKPADKSRCVRLSGLGGMPSYVELLTCLEMAKAASTLPPGDKLTGSSRK